MALLTSVLLQWIIGELACYTYSMVVVPLYDTLGAEAIVFIINQGLNIHWGPLGCSRDVVCLLVISRSFFYDV